PRRGRRVLIGLLVAVLVLVLAAAGAIFALTQSIGNDISRIPDAFRNLQDTDRPATFGGTTFLLVGTDTRATGATTGSFAPAEVDAGSQRSDVIMLATVQPDGTTGSVVSIPRDSWVNVPGRGMNKINASFSLHGARGTQATVEQLTNTRIDHVAIMNWEGFKDLSTALDGVRVYVPETFHDSSQDIDWEKGWHDLEGKRALQYVRTRHGLSDGDFGRIARQQNFLRSMMNKLINEGMTSPTKLPGVLKAITKNLDVDDSWENGDIRDLAFNMRGLDSEKVEFLTAPMASYDDTDVGSVVLLDERRCKKLWRALRGDGEMTISEYADKYRGDSLKAPKKVN
ncbi:MAG: LCP family protein, partial [Actinomycetia bacterium]|nr:LCP family protein [Actinomycetes bacterium]